MGLAIFMFLFGCTSEQLSPEEKEIFGEDEALAGQASGNEQYYDTVAVNKCKEDTNCWQNFLQCYSHNCKDFANTNKPQWGECINECLGIELEEVVEETTPSSEGGSGSSGSSSSGGGSSTSDSEDNLCEAVEDCGFVTEDKSWNGYEIVSKTKTDHDPWVECPEGKKIIGGGCHTGNQGMNSGYMLGDSYPLGDNIWSCQWKKINNVNVSWEPDFTVYAICANIIE